MAKKSEKIRRVKGWKRWLIIAMWTVILIGVISLVALFTMAKTEVLGPMPTFDELENPKTNLATQIYSNDGEVLGTYFIENRTYLSYEELFPADRTKWLEIDGHKLPTIVAARNRWTQAAHDSRGTACHRGCPIL